MSEDKVWSLGFWKERALRCLPNLAWAIDEIRVDAPLDELCVELEVISGQSAYQTRTVILQNLADSIADGYSLPHFAINYLSNGSTRLAVWCLLACFPLAENWQATDRIEMALADLRVWCRGRAGLYATRKSIEAERARAYQIDQNSPEYYYARTVSLLVRVAILSEFSYIGEGAIINNSEPIVLEISREMGMGSVAGANASLMEAVLESILTFPAWEPVR